MGHSLKAHKQSRRFEGALFPKTEKLKEGFADLTLNEYCNMQKNHLKAYLRGDKYFKYKGKWYEVKFRLAD